MKGHKIYYQIYRITCSALCLIAVPLECDDNDDLVSLSQELSQSENCLRFYSKKKETRERTASVESGGNEIFSKGPARVRQREIRTQIGQEIFNR
jgi:hypothetical protein